MTIWGTRMWVCEACDGNGVVIRCGAGATMAPKLGEAGNDDCPVCDGDGIGTEQLDRGDMEREGA